MQAEVQGTGSKECADADMATPGASGSEVPKARVVERLSMNHELFAAGNLRRELLAKQTAESGGSEPLPRSDSNASM